MAFYRRNLPHWQPPDATFFVTWRLDGSLPRAALERMEEMRRFLNREAARPQKSEAEGQIRRFKKLFALYDSLLDQADSGPLWLKNEGVAAVVEDALLSRYAQMYKLWAYVLMANHVHVFLQPKVAQTSVCEASAETVSGTASTQPSGTQTEVCATSEPQYFRLEQITKSLKGSTAREANKLLHRTGRPFWQDESFDHWARDEAEFYRIISYVENNPVKAGMVSKPEDWRWSSAAERKRRGLDTISPLT